jgi:hypothetical protein
MLCFRRDFVAAYIAGAVGSLALLVSTADAATIGFSSQSSFNTTAASGSIAITTDNLDNVVPFIQPQSSLTRPAYTISDPLSSLNKLGTLFGR